MREVWSDQSAFLGERVKNATLRDTACMSYDRRRQTVVLKHVSKWNKPDKKTELSLLDRLDDMSDPEILDKMIIPLIMELGRAEWPRDVISDLSILKGSEKQSGKMKWKPKYDREQRREEAEQEERDTV